jgi:predicted AAA+ superfamily ATPase
VLAVKAVVDRDRRPGQFLLTGSSNFLTVPTISETLAGRTDIVELWPLAQSEVVGSNDTFLNRMLADGLERGRAHVGRHTGRPFGLSRSALSRWLSRSAGDEGAIEASLVLRLSPTVLDREIEDFQDLRDRHALECFSYIACRVGGAVSPRRWCSDPRSTWLTRDWRPP